MIRPQARGLLVHIRPILRRYYRDPLMPWLNASDGETSGSRDE